MAWSEWGSSSHRFLTTSNRDDDDDDEVIGMEAHEDGDGYMRGWFDRDEVLKTNEDRQQQSHSTVWVVQASPFGI